MWIFRNIFSAVIEKGKGKLSFLRNTNKAKNNRNGEGKQLFLRNSSGTAGRRVTFQKTTWLMSLQDVITEFRSVLKAGAGVSF